MKCLTMNLAIAAAAIVAAAGSASAQNLKADIPFTFRAANTTMLPGSYDVKIERSGGSGYLVLFNADNHKSVILAQYVIGDPSKTWKAEGTPKLGFECAGERCVLREAWPGYDAPSYRFRGPKLESGEPTRVAEIAMTRVKAD